MPDKSNSNSDPTMNRYGEALLKGGTIGAAKSMFDEDKNVGNVVKNAAIGSIANVAAEAAVDTAKSVHNAWSDAAFERDRNAADPGSLSYDRNSDSYSIKESDGSFSPISKEVYELIDGDKKEYRHW